MNPNNCKTKTCNVMQAVVLIAVALIIASGVYLGLTAF